MTETSRTELEGLIARGLESLRASETQLCRRYEHLGRASSAARAAFMRSLSDLERQATSLERIIRTLDRMEN